jgi:hypothetical protein
MATSTDFVFDSSLRDMIVEYLGDLPWKQVDPLIRGITPDLEKSGVFKLSRENVMALLNDIMLKDSRIRTFEIIRAGLEKQLQHEQDLAREHLERSKSQPSMLEQRAMQLKGEKKPKKIQEKTASVRNDRRGKTKNKEEMPWKEVHEELAEEKPEELERGLLNQIKKVGAAIEEVAGSTESGEASEESKSGESSEESSSENPKKKPKKKKGRKIKDKGKKVLSKVKRIEKKQKREEQRLRNDNIESSTSSETTESSSREED